MAFHLPIQADMPIRLLQLSDAHLVADVTQSFLGVNPFESLEAVIAELHGQQFDAILSSGDIAQQPVAQTYQHYLNTIAKLQTAHFWIRGNHDAGDDFPKQLPEAMPLVVEAGNWSLLLLDSHKPGHVNGQISSMQLEYIVDYIHMHNDRYIGLVLHHPCFDVGTTWLDPHRLINTDEFLHTIESFDQVRFVLCGHVHQSFTTHHKHIALMSCPSTWRQFAPNQSSFLLDQLPPGYRVIQLYPNGHYTTQVHYIQDWHVVVDDSDHEGY